MKKKNIKEWLVKLKGASYDLEELLPVFNFPSATVFRLNDSFYLKSCELNQLKKATDVHKTAIIFLEVINGAAKLHFDHFGLIESANSLIGIDENGNFHKFAFRTKEQKGSALENRICLT